VLETGFKMIMGCDKFS